VDARSDLFSLGSVLYTMCTGRAPFRAETIPAVLRRITDTQAHSIRAINPNIPEWLEQIVARLQDKSPDRRLQSAGELVDMLEQCLAHLQQPATNSLPESLRGQRAPEGADSTGRRDNRALFRRNLIPIGCGILILLAALIVVNWRTRDPKPASLVAGDQGQHSESVVAVPVRQLPSPAEPDSKKPAPRTPVAETPIPRQMVSKSANDPAPFEENDLPFEFRWNFQEPQPDFILEWGSYGMENCKQVTDGLRVIRRPTSNEYEFAVSFELAAELLGDCELTLDFRDFKSTPTRVDWQVPRIEITGSIYSANDSKDPVHVMGIAHRRTMTGRQRATAMQGDRNVDGELVWKHEVLPANRDSGRLRLVRQNATMFYQTAPLGTEQWITIRSYSVDKGNFKQVVFGLRAEDLNGSGEAVLTNVIIRAHEMRPK
jgi:hypothetical protein